mmetsp:Transcript_95618/g.274477  ORF Transcript_95618/g.274477 Transcript_95618/m.274477 type:complete len:333 (+) Transcript_95618:911-1909(+)
MGALLNDWGDLAADLAHDKLHGLGISTACVGHAVRPLNCQRVALLADLELLGLQGLLQFPKNFLALKELDISELLLLMPPRLPGIQRGPALDELRRRRRGRKLRAAGRRRGRGADRGGALQGQTIDLQRLQQLRPDPEDLPIRELDLPSEVGRAIGSQGAHHAIHRSGLDQAFQSGAIPDVQNGLAGCLGGGLRDSHLVLALLADEPGVQMAEGHARRLRRQPDLDQPLQGRAVPPHRDVVEGLCVGTRRRDDGIDGAKRCNPSRQGLRVTRRSVAVSIQRCARDDAATARGAAIPPTGPRVFECILGVFQEIVHGSTDVVQSVLRFCCHLP